MLGLGLATSHAPSMFRGLECWSPIHRVLTSGVPQPPEIDQETPAVLQSFIERINHGFDALKQQIEAFQARCPLDRRRRPGRGFHRSEHAAILCVYLRRSSWVAQHRPHRRT